MRVRSKGQELELGWDMSLRVQGRRPTLLTSVWLREYGGHGPSRSRYDRREQFFDKRENTKKQLANERGRIVNPVLGFNLEGRKKRGLEEEDQ